MRPATQLGIGVAAAFLTFCLTAFLLNSLAFQLASALGSYPTFIDVVYALAVVTVSLGVGLLVVRALRRRRPWAPLRLPRWGWITLISAYLVTWVFGVTAAQAHDQNIAAERWKHNRSKGYEVHDTPSVNVIAAFPLVPGVTLSYQWVGVGPLDGWQGWVVHVWYGWGVTELHDLTLGVS
jgi:hypothetical protein